MDVGVTKFCAQSLALHLTAVQPCSNPQLSESHFLTVNKIQYRNNSCLLVMGRLNYDLVPEVSNEVAFSAFPFLISERKGSGGQEGDAGQAEESVWCPHVCWDSAAPLPTARGWHRALGLGSALGSRTLNPRD